MRTQDKTFRRDRTITARWLTGETYIDNGETFERAIELTVRHNKDYKAILTSMSPIAVGDYVTRWTSANPGVRLRATRIDRYSDKALEAEFAAILADSETLEATYTALLERSREVDA